MRETVIYGLSGAQLCIRSDAQGIMLVITDVEGREGVRVAVARIRSEDRATLVNACLGTHGRDFPDANLTGFKAPEEVSRPGVQYGHPVAPEPTTAPGVVAFVQLCAFPEDDLSACGPVLYALDQQGRVWYSTPSEEPQSWQLYPAPVER